MAFLDDGSCAAAHVEGTSTCKAKYSKGTSKMQMHIFGDASIKAYGSCEDLRTEDEQGNIPTRLVVVTNRVAPIRTLTLPGLELTRTNMGLKF